jgi:hypothetical protein
LSSDAPPRLRAIFDEQPGVATWLGDLAHHAEAELLRLACGSGLGMAEAIRHRAAMLKLELVGPSPAVIERLLAERVVASWVFLYWAEATAAQAMGVETNSTRQVAFCLERLDRVQRRHLAALRGLATAQSLLPAVKHNPAPPVSERAVGQPRASSEGKAIGAVADGDDRLGPDEQAREPRGLVMFGGDEVDATPAIEAPGPRGRLRRGSV